MFVIPVFYVIITFLVFVIWLGVWLENKDGWQSWKERKTKHAARMALLAPLWPITLMVILVHGFFDLVEDAFK